MKVNPSLKYTDFIVGIDEPSHVRPLRISLIIATGYCILIATYIVISDKIAIYASNDAEQLKSIEQWNGLIFVIVSGAFLFWFSYKRFSRVAEQDDQLIRQHKALISTERLVAAGIVASSVSHDINNVLAVIIGNVEILKSSKNLTNKDMSSVKSIFEASDRLLKLTINMLEGGKSRVPGVKKLQNFSFVVEETVEFAKIHKALRGCQIDSEIEQSISLEINSALMGRSLMNLMINAAQATNGRSKILVRLARKDDGVVLEVHDDGPGVSDEQKEKIFEPFFTSKEDGNGLGLLSLKLCAELHQGAIHLKRSHLGGACFSTIFPSGGAVAG